MRTDDREAQSLAAVGPLVGVRYDIAALLSRFDKRMEGETGLTGKLSSLLGESLLLSALTHYLRDQGHMVEVLDDRPHRDDAEFEPLNEPVPGFRDLDAWLLLDGRRLAAVECKQRTSSSLTSRSIPDDAGSLGAFARAAWHALVSEHFVPWAWTEVNKIALPLRSPLSMPSAGTATARRLLAIWMPVSRSGDSWISTVVTKTICGGQWVDVEVEVFSASLYLRRLLGAGVTHLSSAAKDMQKVLAALDALVEVAPPTA